MLSWDCDDDAEQENIFLFSHYSGTTTTMPICRLVHKKRSHLSHREMYFMTLLQMYALSILLVAINEMHILVCRNKALDWAHTPNRNRKTTVSTKINQFLFSSAQTMTSLQDEGSRFPSRLKFVFSSISHRKKWNWKKKTCWMPNEENLFSSLTRQRFNL